MVLCHKTVVSFLICSVMGWGSGGGGQREGGGGGRGSSYPSKMKRWTSEGFLFVCLFFCLGSLFCSVCLVIEMSTTIRKLSKFGFLLSKTLSFPVHESKRNNCSFRTTWLTLLVFALRLLLVKEIQTLPWQAPKQKDRNSMGVYTFTQRFYLVSIEWVD